MTATTIAPTATHQFPDEYMGQPIDAELLHTLLSAAEDLVDEQGRDLLGFKSMNSNEKSFESLLESYFKGDSVVDKLNPWFTAVFSAFALLNAIAASYEEDEDASERDVECGRFVRAHAECLLHESPKNKQEWQEGEWKVDVDLSLAISTFIDDSDKRCQFVNCMMEARFHSYCECDED